MTWRHSDISIEMVDEDSSDPIVTLEITTPVGVITVMAEFRLMGRIVGVKGAHIESRGISRNDIGVPNLRVIAQTAMEIFDYDGIVIEGAIRATGCQPGPSTSYPPVHPKSSRLKEASGERSERSTPSLHCVGVA